MRTVSDSCQDRTVHPVDQPAAPGGYEPATFHRRGGGRIVGGVAGGLSDHLGVDVFKVRVAFVLLAIMAGAGIFAYGLLWIFSPAGDDVDRPTSVERQRALGLAAVGLGLAAAVAWLLDGTAASALVPIVVVVVGAALVWREFDSDGPRSVLGLAKKPTVLGWARVVGGATLIVLGLGVVVLARVDLASLRSSLLAVIVTLVGAALLTVPVWLRMWRALNAERSARIRNDEREEIASHLHDSVLQTLALIQKQSDQPGEVMRLARSQERELRKWLFEDGDPDHSSLAEALKTISGEVEDQHGITVRPITVGDVQLALDDSSAGLTRETFTAVLGATREALVNAAKHSGETNVDLFAETEDDKVTVFVRDRGTGFDESQVPEDRRGLAKSIRGRIERRGGEVSVRSGVGKGTEVRIMMPRGGSGRDSASKDTSKHNRTETTEPRPQEQHR
ncbi:PspC domain-containing protein [Rhodococcus sp. BP-252]|uniref:ATP-binding protein n=1 Tax=Nocardiaceae TaxID=85025 RepID=UPI000B302B66|nr:ATP-binding protein [Rhodococcus sp. B10]MBY6410575.1 PspC domain-containing protein [Rhodococcus sp. BP-320]MBY6417870.1 PspC domain-containing protein [Rhodococcus sp. BP-321]MBY6422865.1 PspC domain-containing protein [Rhodococcus sp. BP-324]MBY6425131.1 PspC domain-containing protein [Rhodococcus sp. BP-323]MBY6430163.1 PspC domain-containing protein [Rhodococcus sp. BP-322]MBY6439038.1 PspC domain-containing protein [Rhodococcus sp. BP-319]MBY6444000.1 PspC domain-containing protein 